MRPRPEVTIHLTREQYDELNWLLGASDRMCYITEGLTAALQNPVLDPLLDERVTIGTSFKRGQG